jgi:hypothetical protein
VKPATYALDIFSRFGTDPQRVPYAPTSHIVDTVYFGNSEESRAIQLADVCCATITRWLRNDAAVLPYYYLLQGQVLGAGISFRLEDVQRMAERAKSDR